MGFDLEELKFCGFANTVAIEEFSASFDEAQSSELQEALYREYVNDGRPRDKRQWLRTRLATLFKYATAPPAWIESSAQWPFLHGMPMTFVGQLTVSPDASSNIDLLQDAVLYIFAARTPSSHIKNGWEVAYQVVTQYRSLA